MAKYILIKKAKGKKYQYTVTDEKGNVVSTRTSARDYVACTANGEFCYCAAQMALEKMNPRT